MLEWLQATLLLCAATTCRRLHLSLCTGVKSGSETRLYPSLSRNEMERDRQVVLHFDSHCRTLQKVGETSNIKQSFGSKLNSTQQNKLPLHPTPQSWTSTHRVTLRLSPCLRPTGKPKSFVLFCKDIAKPGPPTRLSLQAPCPGGLTGPLIRRQSAGKGKADTTCQLSSGS